MRTHLSPKDLALATGISESSVKRWIDQGLISAVKTEGGHRRIALDEAIRYIREHRLDVVSPQALGLTDLNDLSPAGIDLSQASPSLSQALQAGLGPQVRGQLLSLYLAGHPIAAIADGPIAVAMHEIGELWRTSKAGIYVEHRATQLCLAAIQQLQALLPPPGDDAPLAMGAAPEGDPYLLPCMLASATLASLGWRVVNLGPQTPFDVFDHASCAERPDLHWLSITSPQAESLFLHEVEAFCDQLSRRGGRLIVGGQQAPSRLRHLAPALHVAGTMAEMAAYAAGLQTAGLTRSA